MPWRLFRLSRHLDSMKGAVRSRRAPFGASMSAVRLPYCCRCLRRSSFSRPTRFLVLYSMALFSFIQYAVTVALGQRVNHFLFCSFESIIYCFSKSLVWLITDSLISFVSKHHCSNCIYRRKRNCTSLSDVCCKKVQVHVDRWCRFPELAFLLHLLECDDTACTVTWHGTFLYLRYSLWHTIMYWH